LCIHEKLISWRRAVVEQKLESSLARSSLNVTYLESLRFEQMTHTEIFRTMKLHLTKTKVKKEE
jgi:hypothetical protein